MPRTPSDPSGVKIVVSVTLSPNHLRKLDDIAGARALSRSATVEALIDARGVPTIDKPAAPKSGCDHPNPVDIGGGMNRCGDCSWRQGKDGVWRAPR